MPNTTNVSIALKRLANIDRHNFQSFIDGTVLQISTWGLEILRKTMENVMTPARQ